MNILQSIRNFIFRVKTEKKEKVYTVEEFNALPKDKQKVIIAKDVIAQLNANKYVASKGNWIKALVGHNLEGSVRDNFDEIESCTVCALGACLLSAVKYKNELEFSDLNNNSFTQNSKVANLFTSIFTPSELKIIEGAFEGGNNAYTKMSFKVTAPKTTGEELTKFHKFYNSYENDDQRLRALMQGIIDNNGEVKI